MLFISELFQGLTVYVLTLQLVSIKLIPKNSTLATTQYHNTCNVFLNGGHKWYWRCISTADFQLAVPQSICASTGVIWLGTAEVHVALGVLTRNACAERKETNHNHIRAANISSHQEFYSSSISSLGHVHVRLILEN